MGKRDMIHRTWAGLLIGGLVMTLATAGGGPLEGAWGGDRVRLVVDGQGATVEMDCADGRIVGPITLTGNGTFSAAGTFEQHQAGPQAGDARHAPTPARYSGDLSGDLLTLRIQPTGNTPVQTFKLRRGAKVKLVRCL